MMLYVNTIEFDGRKAVINSYSDHPALVASMTGQQKRWASKYPNATIRTEEMSEADCMRLVAAGEVGPLRSLAYEIGQASQA
jgi:hypothetical protein